MLPSPARESSEFVPLSTIMALIVCPLLSAGWLDHGARLLLDLGIAVDFGPLVEMQKLRRVFKIYFFI